MSIPTKSRMNPSRLVIAPNNLQMESMHYSYGKGQQIAHPKIEMNASKMYMTI